MTAPLAAAQARPDSRGMALAMTGALVDAASTGGAEPAAATQLLADVLLGVPHVVFWVKSPDGRYLAVNQAFADRAQRRVPADVVGLSARELFPAGMAAACEAQDRFVIASGRPLRNEFEVVVRPDGTPGWYVTNKVPAFDESGSPVCTIGVSVDLQKPADGGDELEGLAAAVAVIRERYCEPLRVEDIAAEAGMTPLQLERRMRRFLGVAPKQYVRRMRVEQAGRLLATTDLSVARIAALCGYYDQSALTSHFKRVTGLTPREWAARLSGGQTRPAVAR